MSKLKNYILPPLTEAAYHGNIGFEEMVKFYREANDREIEEMEAVIKKDDWEGFRRLIKRVLNVELKK